VNQGYIKTTLFVNTSTESSDFLFDPGTPSGWSTAGLPRPKSPAGRPWLRKTEARLQIGDPRKRAEFAAALAEESAPSHYALAK